MDADVTSCRHHQQQQTIAPIVVITGRSRSGKSRLARDLQKLRLSSAESSSQSPSSSSSLAGEQIINLSGQRKRKIVTILSQDSFRVPKGPERDAAGLPLLKLRLNGNTNANGNVNENGGKEEGMIVERLDHEHYAMTRWNDLWDAVLDAALIGGGADADAETTDNRTDLVIVEGYSLAMDAAGLDTKLKQKHLACRERRAATFPGAGAGVTWLYLRDPALDENYEVFKSRRRDVPGVKGKAHLQWLCCDDYCRHAWDCGSAYESGVVREMVDTGEMWEVMVPNNANDDDDDDADASGSGTTKTTSGGEMKRLPDPNEWERFVRDVARMIGVLGA